MRGAVARGVVDGRCGRAGRSEGDREVDVAVGLGDRDVSRGRNSGDEAAGAALEPITTMPVASPIDAFVAPVSVTANVRGAFAPASVIGMTMFFTVWPGAKVSVLLTAL